MSSMVVSPSTFSVSKVTFSPVKTLQSGGKQAYLNYDGRPLVMQIGPLETTFGLSVYDKVTPPKYSVDLNLRGYDDPVNYPKVAMIYKALHDLDEYMLDQAVKNCKAWFKSEKSREVLGELYTPSVKFAKDDEGNLKPYPPTLKLKLNQREGKFETVVYDDKKRPLTDVPLEDVLVKKATLTSLIQCTGIWFAGGKFGIGWKAIQIRADSIPESLHGCGFIDDDAEEGTAAPASRAAAPAPKAAAASQASKNAFAALHDDDDDEVDDEETLKAPAAPAAPTPAAAPASAPAAPTEEDSDAEDAAPIPVPAKKTLVTKKKIVTAAAKK